MKVVIVNDTAKRFPFTRYLAYAHHFGCQLVMKTFREQLDRVDIELLGTVPKQSTDFSIAEKADLVIVNGEGSIHHGRRAELINIATQYPCVLINAVYQDNPYREALRQFRYIAVRESDSARELEQQGIKPDIVPDIIFTSSTLNAFKAPAPTRDLGITDSVLSPKSESLIRKFLTWKPADERISAFQPPKRFLTEIAKHRRLCIGRYHGVIAASVLRIPYSAWASNTHKISGIMTDMGINHLFAEQMEDALDIVPQAFDERIDAYVSRARILINAMFESLHRYV